ncbi:MAG: zinc ribbon domain-containing protein [Deltaproteobacteria bacterium]|nr:zinc ribbon domain-containing protein [Deltaproteobacteria bacterium]
MPIYEFECSDCGQVFETIQSISSKENPPCPKCKCEKTRKVISAGVRAMAGGVPSLSAGSQGSCSPRAGFS